MSGTAIRVELPAHLRTLARISGQVTGIQKMVENDRTCGDILQQIVAVAQRVRITCRQTSQRRPFSS